MPGRASPFFSPSSCGLEGETAWADLDAITAALELTGGAAAESLIMFGVFDETGKAFSNFMSGSE